MGKRKYDEEFKQKIVGLYQSGRRQSELMREFGIAKSMLQEWRRKYSLPIELSLDGELSELQKDVISLQVRIRQLEKENEILKSAVQWVEKKKT